MALSLLLCAAQMVDYGAKILLLVCLGREPALRAHFVALAVAHVGSNLHNSYLFFRAAPGLPLVVQAPCILVLGVATPLMQVVQIWDALAAWWFSQDVGRKLPLRSAPLDIVLEGLTFVLTVLHLQISLVLGRLDARPGALPVGAASGLPVEALLSLTLFTSLIAVATALVIWDSSVSLRLSRGMFGWPGPRDGGGVRGWGLFLVHLAFRGSEVAGKSAILAGLAVLLGTSCALRYTAASYLGILIALLLLSSQRASPRKAGAPPTTTAGAGPLPLLASLVLALPLLFANLPQFVDCPKHAAAAQNLAGVIFGFRALELAAALSAVVAAVLLEDEIASLSGGLACAPSPGHHHHGHHHPHRGGGGGGAAHGGLSSCLGAGMGLGLGGFASGGAAGLLRAWRALYNRNATLLWGLCSLLHYLCVASRWCSTAVAECAAPLAPFSSGSGAHSPNLEVAGRSAHREEKDFWPPAAGLAPLLLAAACERAPVAWPLGRTGSSTSGIYGIGRGSGRGGVQYERQVQVEDFDVVRLIGSGEFGKVFEVKHRVTQETFAMKRLSKEFYARRRMTDKAIREIATLHLARDHPFVVRLVWTIENAREWALVMEYCPGGDLQQLLLAEGSPGLTLSRTLRISAEVTLALEHLHARGIVFRDLKVENVVLDAEGHARLTDFGLAKQHLGGRDAIAEAELAGDVYASFTKTFCGSYGYAAPEVNPRRQVHGFAADMYSFGVLMLMMLMGGEVYHDARDERRLPPETPKDLRSIINQLTFEFYWGSHHFLRPAGAAHRVEVNLNGAVVLSSRGPRGARRQERPRRPPNSPRQQQVPAWPPSPPASGSGSALGGRAAGSQEPTAGGLGRTGSHPAHFPALACASSEAAQRRWDLAMDLIRVLTNELPENRGTVARVKQHAFFAEEIADWRTVYPRGWLQERVKARLLGLVGGGALPAAWEAQLGRLSAEELMALQDDPAANVELLERARPGLPDSGQEPSRTGAGGSGGPAASSTGERQHGWVANYP